MQEKIIHKSLNVVSDQKGYFVACISTDNVDKVDEVVLQQGISFKTLPLAFLYEHNTLNNWILGTITKSYIKDNKMMVEGSYDLTDALESGLTKEEKLAKYEAAKQGMDKLSIGLSYAINDIIIEGDIRTIKRCVISEVSQVKNPANPYTFFAEIKNLESDNIKSLNNTLMNLYNKEKEIEYNKENELKLVRKQTIKEIYNKIENAERLSDVKRCIRTLKEMYAIKPEELTTKIFRFFQKKYLTNIKPSDLSEENARFEGNLPSLNTDELSLSRVEIAKNQEINKDNKSIKDLLNLYISQKNNN